MSDTVRIDVTDRIATLTLNRPRKLNALNYETIDRMMELLDAIEVSADVQAVIITGAGPRAFSAGGDIHEFSQSVKLGADTAVRDFVRWEEFRMHVRAALTQGGFTADDIKEIIRQQANYCGVPVGNHAFREAEAVLREVGKLP